MSLGAPKIAIVGAGIVGLSCAWELLKRGASVTLFEKHWPPTGASWAAAGMLAPAYEAASVKGGHPRFLDLCCRSAELWAGFAAELERASGVEIGYRRGPSLAIALDEVEADHLRGLAQQLVSGTPRTKHLHRRDVSALEPSVSPDFEIALQLESDGWVNPRQTLFALRKAIEGDGGLIERVPVGVSVSDLKDEYDICLNATGASAHGSVRAVKGVMLAFRRADLPLDHVVRCGAEYAVPRGDRILVGATVGEVPEPRSFLLSRAVGFLPRIRSAALLDQWNGWRPATADHAPILGRTGTRRSYLANGHYRNGILLAPVTAEIMAEMMLEGRVSDLAASFTPERFGATA